MSQELVLQRLMLGGFTGSGVLTLGCLAGLFIVAVYKPERIRAPRLFGWSAAMVSFSLFASPVAIGLVQALVGDIYSRNSRVMIQNSGPLTFFTLLPTMIDAVFLAIGVFLMFKSLHIRVAAPYVEAAEPKPVAKHPLD